jgi:hypothetical protein
LFTKTKTAVSLKIEHIRYSIGGIIIIIIIYHPELVTPNQPPLRTSHHLEYAAAAKLFPQFTIAR